MDAKFIEYYKSLGMGEPLIEKMSTIHHQLGHIADNPPKEVVVSEYVTDNGQREYLKAFFFSDGFVYEVEKLMSETPEIWIAKLGGNIGSFGLTPKDYDFDAAKPESRLNLECYWAGGTTFELNVKTSGDNCSHLFGILNKYIKPNLA